MPERCWRKAPERASRQNRIPGRLAALLDPRMGLVGGELSRDQPASAPRYELAMKQALAPLFPRSGHHHLNRAVGQTPASSRARFHC